MKWRSMLTTVGAMLLLAAPPAAAQSGLPQPLEFTVTVTGHAGIVKGSRSDHFLSFSGPIEIPGVGLEPGTYIFQPLEGGMVRVMNADRSKVYATLFTTPVFRPSARDINTLVTFDRTANDGPVRIASWFPQGQQFGMAPLYASASASMAQVGD